jgi:hypothetical protein
MWVGSRLSAKLDKLTVIAAVITLIPAGRVTLAWAVDDPMAPPKAVLLTGAPAGPTSGVIVSWADVPRGIPEPWRFTVTGLGCVAGKTMSGGPDSEPSGAEGAETPPTEAITRLGPPLGIETGFGVDRLIPPEGTLGVNAPVV